MPKQKKIYFIRAGNTNRVKIGCAVSVGDRIRTLQTGCPEPLRVLLVIPNGSLKLETAFHKKFKQNRILGEWFYYYPRIASYVDKVLENQEKEAEAYWEKQAQDYWDEQQAKWEAEQDAQEDS